MIRSQEPSPPPEIGQILGTFKIVRELGHGGMGTVFLAKRADGQFEQRVAIKVIRSLGRCSRDAARRFQVERQILAGLEHPNITRLLDGGLTADGSPYFVMEYVEGEPIDQFCDHRRLTINYRLRLFLDVARAVEAAHRSLVIHRDLKPGNILVTKDGVVKLLDFGIAKILDDENASSSDEDAVTANFTATMAMTPQYASPEQFSGRGIGTATDVYQLGILLYEILTGVHPLPVKGLPPIHAQQRICDVNPTRPSVACAREPAARDTDRPSVEQRGRLRHASVKGLSRILAGDLDTIVLNALRKEPSRRYGSATALISDLERYLGGYPILARADSTLYRLGKFARRNLAAVSVAALAGLLLAALIGFYTIRLQRKSDEALKEARRAQQVSSFLTQVFVGSDPYQTFEDDLSARELLDRGAASLEELEEPEVRASMGHLLGTIYRRMTLFDPARSLLEKALKDRRGLLGNDHPETADTLFELAITDMQTSRLDEAGAGYKEALEVWRRALGNDDPRLVRGLSQYAALHRRNQDFATALELGLEAVALGERILGPDSPQLAPTLNGVGIACQRLGEHEQALTYLDRAYELQSQLDPNHPSLAGIRSSFASLYDAVDRREEARDMYHQVLDDQLRIFGEESSQVGTVLLSLGDVYFRLKENEKAIEYGLQAAATFRHAFDEPHLYEAFARLNIAMAYSELDRFADSWQQATQAQAIVTQRLPEPHPLAAMTSSTLGEILRRWGRPEEALDRQIQAVRRMEDHHGPNHSDVSTVRLDLGRTYLDLGRFDEARATLERSLEIRRAVYDADHSGIAEVEEVLARLENEARN